jgi:hypothetical protein
LVSRFSLSSAGLACVASLMVLIGFIQKKPSSVQLPTERSLFVRVAVPPPVAHSLRTACLNCHSDETNWPWYAHVPVISHFLQEDVRKARAHLNLSDWQSIEERGPDELVAAFSGICENMLSGAMPKQRYTWLHPEARLSKPQVAQVCQWTQQHGAM